jgi:hypothetical protein
LNGVRVSYRYGFSADIGGGEYSRPILEPSPRDVAGDEAEVVTPEYYRVGAGQQFEHLSDAISQWRSDDPYDAVIEITDSDVYADAIRIVLGDDRSLQIRAANWCRPVIRLVDRYVDRSDALTVTMGRGSRLTLDGLLISGRALQINGQRKRKSENQSSALPSSCGARLVIRHCTLVPGWELKHDCDPVGPGKPALEIVNLRASVWIEHSIVGSIRVQEDEVRSDPIPLHVSDSILDATDDGKLAISGTGSAVAHVLLTAERVTIFGIVEVHAMVLAEDSIFSNCVNVARRQIGCMRFCYVPPGCRTPRRYNCQPDLVVQAAQDSTADAVEQARRNAFERLRVVPQFDGVRYGTPGYARLALSCSCEIKRGAEDESEMGALHDLFEPQRLANLVARLEEYTPAARDCGVLFAT